MNTLIYWHRWVVSFFLPRQTVLYQRACTALARRWQVLQRREPSEREYRRMVFCLQQYIEAQKEVPDDYAVDTIIWQTLLSL